ncbi:MAG: S46 family peptidase [Bacteroidales bacterium]|nr:S46 family peptidase [Bacteroidales bacterium]
MKKLILLLILSFFSAGFLGAEEGIWIPVLLEQLNIRKMQDMGLRLSAEDIYSVNHSSLKDAIVQFGGGCTAEIVSSKGLILTNYHCGLGSIQRQSSLQHDYLNEGFWAASMEEERPCAGLTVTLLNRMEDVTDKILQGVDETMNQLQRTNLVKLNSDKVEKEATLGGRYEAKVRSFFYGNRYYLVVNEVFKDIRLVGAPPSNIGKFGGDTDNWMWPRHTGDFSIFRIYANKNNEPATYSVENIPYIPRKYLPISLGGYQQGDFTFLLGYPGTTSEYLTSYGVDLIANEENPLRIRLREKRLEIINAAMSQNKLIRLQYTPKANGIANGWKKMIGQTRGIRKAETVLKKSLLESSFQAWADSTSERRIRYGNLLSSFQTFYHHYLPVDRSSIYLTEAGQAIEIVRFASGFRDLVKLGESKEFQPASCQKLVEGLAKTSRDFYKNYNIAIDKQVMFVMLGEMKLTPEKADLIITHSIFSDSTRLLKFLGNFKQSDVKLLKKDLVYQLMLDIYNRYEKEILPEIKKYTVCFDSLQRVYMMALMEWQREMNFYPDANLTFRIAFGKVEDLIPADAVKYNYFTTLEGIMQKEDSSIYDYRVDNRLKYLYKNHDYGRYADRDGTIHTAFLASNHTSGGNSGSPVLNAWGQLIGINFDRNWEGTLSDLMYDPSQCRNISLDIRYCLFVIDKVAGAKRLIEEMEIIPSGNSQ